MAHRYTNGPRRESFIEKHARFRVIARSFCVHFQVAISARPTSVVRGGGIYESNPN
jgi:hypothetical protein